MPKRFVILFLIALILVLTGFALLIDSDGRQRLSTATRNSIPPAEGWYQKNNELEIKNQQLQAIVNEQYELLKSCGQVKSIRFEQKF